MNQCAGTKRSGEGCSVTVEEGQAYCWWHSPAYSEERRRAASKGGKAKANPLTRELHRQLETLALDVASGDLPAYRGAVVVQVLNCRIRLIETERRIQEQTDLLERLEQLEHSRAGGAGRWGA
jgi:hypothetical protein